MTQQVTEDVFTGRLASGPASPASSRCFAPSLLCADLLLWDPGSLRVIPKNPSANGEVPGDKAEQGVWGLN